METLVVHSPFVLGLAAAAAISRGHRWLVLIGSALGVGTILYALAFVSDEAGFILSDQELFIVLAVYGWSLWLGGVAIGSVFGRARSRRGRRRSTTRAGW